MFMKLIATLLAGLGLTVGGLSLHGSLSAQARGQSAAHTTSSTGAAATQTQSALLAGDAAGFSAHGKAAGAVVPAVVTQVSGSSVTVAPVSLAQWDRAGLSNDATLTVALTLSANELGLSVQLSEVGAGAHVLLRVQQGVVTQVQLQGGPAGQAGTQPPGSPTEPQGSSAQPQGSVTPGSSPAGTGTSGHSRGSGSHHS